MSNIDNTDNPQDATPVILSVLRKGWEPCEHQPPAASARRAGIRWQVWLQQKTDKDGHRPSGMIAVNQLHNGRYGCSTGIFGDRSKWKAAPQKGGVATIREAVIGAIRLGRERPGWEDILPADFADRTLL